MKKDKKFTLKDLEECKMSETELKEAYVELFNDYQDLGFECAKQGRELETIKSDYKIITLCGSTKFKDEFERVNKELTLKGNIVISVACFGHSGDVLTEEQKVLLDDIHKTKIDLADAIYVINKGGYIGNSTRNEIEYAQVHNKEIIYMEKNNDKQRMAKQFERRGTYFKVIKRRTV